MLERARESSMVGSCRKRVFSWPLTTGSRHVFMAFIKCTGASYALVWPMYNFFPKAAVSRGVRHIHQKIRYMPSKYISLTHFRFFPSTRMATLLSFACIIEIEVMAHHFPWEQ